MSLPPEREFNACMEVVRVAMLEARVWGWRGNVPAEQLADLMDAIHNIPSLVAHWEGCDQEWLRRSLEQYERKWARSEGPCLRTLYERALSGGVRAESKADVPRPVACDPDAVQHAAHDAINIFVRDVLIPRGLIDPAKYDADGMIVDLQREIAIGVSQRWRQSKLCDDAEGQ